MFSSNTTGQAKFAYQPAQYFDAVVDDPAVTGPQAIPFTYYFSSKSTFLSAAQVLLPSSGTYSSVPSGVYPISTTGVLTSSPTPFYFYPNRISGADLPMQLDTIVQNSNYLLLTGQTYVDVSGSSEAVPVVLILNPSTYALQGIFKPTNNSFVFSFSDTRTSKNGTYVYFADIPASNSASNRIIVADTTTYSKLYSYEILAASSYKGSPRLLDNSGRLIAAIDETSTAPTISRLATNGTASYTQQLSSSAGTLYLTSLLNSALDTADNLYLALRVGTTKYLVKINANGTKGFEVSYPSNSAVAPAAYTDAADNVYFVDYSGTTVYITKFTSSATLDWRRKITVSRTGATYDSSLSAPSVVVNAGDGIYLSWTGGQVNPSPNINQLGLWAKIKEDGSTLGTYTNGAYTFVHADATDIVFSNTTNINWTTVSSLAPTLTSETVTTSGLTMLRAEAVTRSSVQAYAPTV